MKMSNVTEENVRELTIAETETVSGAATISDPSPSLVLTVPATSSVHLGPGPERRPPILLPFPPVPHGRLGS